MTKPTTTNQKYDFIKRSSTMFLKVAGIVAGGIVLAIAIFAIPAMWRAVPGEYQSFNISYAFYIILTAMYLAAVLFFYALYQAMRLLSYVDCNQAFSRLTVRALRQIARASAGISAVFAGALPFFYVWANADDAPGLVLIGMLFVAAPLTVAVFAGVLQRLFDEAIVIKSENDLTV